MTAGGDAVLAHAYTWVGQPNGDPFWAWWGADLGSYCACFVSYCHAHAGYPICSIDGQDGFVLVSNGTWHSYTESEARPTDQLYPGCTILFSWYGWQFENGMPIITEDPWIGWVAGDHTGLFSHWIDQAAGRFATVEGNTSGGVVAYREDRYASQVCGWWEPPSIQDEWPPDLEDEDMKEEDFQRIQQIIHDEVVNVWRAAEMEQLDKNRAQAGSHEATLGIIRSDEYAQILQRNCGG